MANETPMTFDGPITLSNIFHEIYLPGLTRLYNNTSFIWNQAVAVSRSGGGFTFGRMPGGGTQVEFGLTMSRVGGAFGPMQDSGALLNAQSHELARGKQTVFPVQQAVGVSPIASDFSGAGSFEDENDQHMINAMDSFTQKMSWLCYANPAGTFAQSTGAVSAIGTTAKAVPVDNWQLGAYDDFFQDMIDQDFDFIASGDINLGALKTGETTNSIDATLIFKGFNSAGAPTFVRRGTTDQTVADNSYLVLSNYGANPSNRQKAGRLFNHTNYFLGLDGIINNSGDLHGVKAADWPTRWQSYVKSGAGDLSTDNAATAGIFDDLVDQIALRSGKELSSVSVLMYPTKISAYGRGAMAKQRYRGVEAYRGHEYPRVQAGMTTVRLQGDRYCPQDKAFMIPEGELLKFQVGDGIGFYGPPGTSGPQWRHFFDGDGTAFHRYQTNFGTMIALGTKRRNCFAKLVGIS